MEGLFTSDDAIVTVEATQPPYENTIEGVHRDGERFTASENCGYMDKDVVSLPLTLKSESSTLADSVFSSIKSEIEFRTETDFLDSKVNMGTLDLDEGDSGLVPEGDAYNPMPPKFHEQGGAMGTMLPLDGNRENYPNLSSGGAIAPDDTTVGKLLTPAEINGNKIKKPKYKKRKKPPPFIGPQRPIQFEDLEDIMNGVYDLHFDILGSDEEPCEMSSSNESCNSSDSEGWLVESDNGINGATARGRSSPDIINKNLELVQKNLNQAHAAKERLNNAVIFINAEGNVAALDARVREMVSAVDPKLEEGLNALDALASAPISSLSLIKHTHLLETAARLCKYTPPPQPATDRPSRSRHSLAENATKICDDAEKVLAHMMELIGLSNGADFWKEFTKKVENFENITKDMSENEKFMVTDDVPECKAEPEEKRYPMMMIDDPWEDNQFADDESETERVSSKRVLPRRAAGTQKVRKKFGRTEPDRVLKPIENIEENASMCTTGSSSSNAYGDRGFNPTSDEKSRQKKTKVKARRSSQKENKAKKNTEPAFVSPLLRRS